MNTAYVIAFILVLAVLALMFTSVSGFSASPGTLKQLRVNKLYTYHPYPYSGYGPYNEYGDKFNPHYVNRNVYHPKYYRYHSRN